MGFDEAGVAMEVSATSSQTSFHSEWTQMQVAPQFSVHQSTRKGKERKGKRTCIAPIVSISTTKRSDVDHTQLPAFPSYKYSLEGDTAANSVVHLATNILLIPNPTEGRRLSWLGWLTHSGRLTHEVVTHQP